MFKKLKTADDIIQYRIALDNDIFFQEQSGPLAFEILLTPSSG
ncbi:hypothetical protein DSUL_50383 [Desulfovibrionales bacterium]